MFFVMMDVTSCTSVCSLVKLRWVRESKYSFFVFCMKVSAQMSAPTHTVPKMSCAGHRDGALVMHWTELRVLAIPLQLVQRMWASTPQEKCTTRPDTYRT